MLHLGSIDESLLRCGDIYLSIQPPFESLANAAQAARDCRSNEQPTNETESDTVTSQPPVLCATWRSTTATSQGVTCVQRKRIDSPTVTPLTLEMLSEELPQLLRSLLVGVELAINRVPLDELSVFHPSETTAALQQQQHQKNYAAALRHSESSASSASSSAGSVQQTQHAKLLLSPLGSPKCGLKRREMISKNKMSNKYALKRMTSTASSDGGAADVEPPLSNLPLFCLGRSFPHIDSDDAEESGDDASTIKPDSGECIQHNLTTRVFDFIDTIE